MSVARAPGAALRLAVLLSGSGTSLQNLIDRIEARRAAGRDRRGDRLEAGRLRPRARAPARHPRDRRAAQAAPRRRRLQRRAACRARALRRRPRRCCSASCPPSRPRGRFDGRAINVHPALVPAFSGKGCYGHRVHAAVIESGVKLTGATVHFVDGEYDHGPDHPAGERGGARRRHARDARRAACRKWSGAWCPRRSGCSRSRACASRAAGCGSRADTAKNPRVAGSAAGGGLRRMARRSSLRDRVPFVISAPSRNQTISGPAALSSPSAHPPPPTFESAPYRSGTNARSARSCSRSGPRRRRSRCGRAASGPARG